MRELFREDPYLRSCTAQVKAVGARATPLDQPVFSPTGGGRPGDTGRLRTEDGRAVPIVDTVKGEGDEAWHVPAPDAALLREGEAVTGEIDWDRRHRHMRMHT